MSGLFGIVADDPVDPRDVERAGRVAAHRGAPRVVGGEGWVLGVYAGGGIVRSADEILLVDGRVDGLLVGDRRRDETAASTFERTLREHGPEGLARIAADFALATYHVPTRRLLLARDAFGMRPLFWAKTARAVAFASDPEVLVALGVATGSRDDDMFELRMACLPIPGDRTAFAGVRRVAGGRWTSFEGRSVERTGRWFRPEDVVGRDRDPASAADGFRQALLAAIASRVEGSRTALSLSGGRDSGAIALALRELGHDAIAITYAFDPELGCSESDLAEPLARAAGFPWSEALVPSRVDERDLATISSRSGTPFAPVAFPIALAMLEAAERAGATTVMDGEGGDLLVARPLVVAELLRRGRVADAWSVARAFNRHVGMPWSIVAKWVGRAFAPQGVLARVDRRASPPWALSPPRSAPAPRPIRDARTDLVSGLIESGNVGPDEPWERLLALRGMTAVSPMLDLRVITAILRMPLGARVPGAAYKPVLRNSFLGPWEASRRKVTQAAYFSRLLDELSRDHPDLFDERSRLVQVGLIRPIHRRDIVATRSIDALYLVGPETWLRSEGS